MYSIVMNRGSRGTNIVGESVDARFDVNNFILIAVVGIIVLTCISAVYTEDGANGPATKGIWGYGLIAIALFGMLIYSYRRVAKESQTSTLSSWEFAMQTILTAGAPGSMLFVIIALIYLNGYFYTQINRGVVAPEYYNYSTLAITIIAIQLAVLLRLFQAKQQRKRLIEDNASALVYLLSVAGIVNAGIMSIILYFFSTDG